MAIREYATKKKASDKATEMAPVIDSGEKKAKHENSNHPGNQPRAHSLDVGAAAARGDSDEQSDEPEMAPLAPTEGYFPRTVLQSEPPMPQAT